MTITNLDDVKKLSEQVLEENYIEEPPVNIYEVAKNYGLEVEEQYFPARYSQISGFITEDNGKPHLVVNAADSQNRKNFTVGHELGHWLMHRDKLRDDPKVGVLFRIPLGKLNVDPLEKQANTFAANLLVPEKMLLERKKLGLSQKDLANIFGVSEEVIGYRLEHIECITHLGTNYTQYKVHCQHFVLFLSRQVI